MVFWGLWGSGGSKRHNQRLYLLATVGQQHIKSKEAPAKEILKELRDWHYAYHWTKIDTGTEKTPCRLRKVISLSVTLSPSKVNAFHLNKVCSNVHQAPAPMFSGRGSRSSLAFILKRISWKCAPLELEVTDL
eukprot:1128889-Amphidinium_carterae.1